MTTTPTPTTTAALRPKDFTYNYGIKSLLDHWTVGLIDFIARYLNGAPCLIEIAGLMHLGTIEGARNVRHDPGTVTIVHASGTRTSYSVRDVGYIVPLAVNDAHPFGGCQGWKWDVSTALREAAHLAHMAAADTWIIDGARPYGKVRMTPRTGGAWDVHFTPQADADHVRDGYYAMPETIVTVDADGNCRTTFTADKVRVAR